MRPASSVLTAAQTAPSRAALSGKCWYAALGETPMVWARPRSETWSAPRSRTWRTASSTSACSRAPWWYRGLAALRILSSYAATRGSQRCSDRVLTAFRSLRQRTSQNSVQIIRHPSGRPVMLERLGHLVVRRRRATLVLFVLGLVAAGVLGPGVFSRLQAGGFTDPGSDSAKATQQLRDQFGVADPVAALAVVTPHGLSADAGPATALVANLQKEPGVTRVVSWWTSGRPDALAGKDGRTGEVLVYSRADATDSQKGDLATRIVAGYGEGHAADGGLTVHVSGAPAINNAITD